MLQNGVTFSILNKTISIKLVVILGVFLQVMLLLVTVHPMLSRVYSIFWENSTIGTLKLYIH